MTTSTARMALPSLAIGSSFLSRKPPASNSADCQSGRNSRYRSPVPVLTDYERAADVLVDEDSILGDTVRGNYLHRHPVVQFRNDTLR